MYLDRGSELSGHGILQQYVGEWMCGEREEALLWCPLNSLIPVSVVGGIHRAWRQREGGRVPHILDALLQGLATDRPCKHGSMLPFENIILIHFPSVKYFLFKYMYLFLSGKKSLWYLSACIDPLSTPLKDPTCIPNNLFYLLPSCRVHH